jgi:hypothetical protein
MSRWKRLLTIAIGPGIRNGIFKRKGKALRQAIRQNRQRKLIAKRMFSLDARSPQT